MGTKVGIRQNTTQIIISGCRVAYDARSTGEANNSRDPKNYKADEQPLREFMWKARQKRKQSVSDEEAA